MGQALEVNEIEEQLENIRLTHDLTESLRMQDMLGIDYETNKNKSMNSLFHRILNLQTASWVTKMQTLESCTAN